MNLLVIYLIKKKAELIKLENRVKLSRQTTYYHESKYSDSFITQKEKTCKNPQIPRTNKKIEATS